MTNRTFKATELFGVQPSPLSQLFKLSVQAVFGAQALGGNTALMSQTDQKVELAFYMCERLSSLVCPNVERMPRIILTLMQRDDKHDQPARAFIGIDAHPRANGYGPVTIEVLFPDRIVGFENLQPGGEQSSYRGLFFNTTNGEYHGNLFEVLNSVSVAFAIAFSEVTSHLNRQ